ncbi:type IV secretion system protein [Flagellimonas beolgyonensis]|uniref:type IV secretion system protein n=1 Tax=Flagellimonas beolgyonensis TaxID=864064 RepID=UPI000F8D62F8|nr:type IV secretion system protein [Allomuricauda beolgyonensis]
MDISYDVLLALYQQFFEEELHLKDLTNVLKILAIAFFLINAYTNMFSKMTDRFGTTKLPFNEKQFFSSLFMVMVIVFYDKLLNFLDTLLLGMDEAYSKFSPLDFAPPEEEIKKEDEADVWAILKLAGSHFIQFMTDPSYIVLLLLKGLAWIIDTAIYAVFLMERFFFIGLLKVLGAIAIVLAVFEKFRDLFYKWLKLYIAIYLLIFPFFLILGFTAFIFDAFEQNADMPLLGNTIQVTVLSIMIWLKLRLFKKSYDIVYKLFT